MPPTGPRGRVVALVVWGWGGTVVSVEWVGAWVWFGAMGVVIWWSMLVKGDCWDCEGMALGLGGGGSVLVA